jgi:hypothetical protein
LSRTDAVDTRKFQVMEAAEDRGDGGIQRALSIGTLLPSRQLVGDAIVLAARTATRWDGRWLRAAVARRE